MNNIARRHVLTFAIVFVAILGMVWNARALARLQETTDAKPYVLVAAPRENRARGERDYGPIAAFLTQALGHKVVYKHPDGWLTYELWIWKDRADIYFDGPQFDSWRLHYLDQTIGPRVPQPQEWRLYTWKGSPITSIKEAENGAVLCAPPIPNFGTLWVTSLFKDPSRQPYFRNTRGWKSIFDAVRKHRCLLGIGPRLTVHYLDAHHTEVTVLKKSRPYNNQAFTISAQLPPAVRAAIVRALLSPAGEESMMRLRRRFSHGLPLVAGHASEYLDADRELDAQWGTIYATGIDRYLKQDAKREGLPFLPLVKP